MAQDPVLQREMFNTRGRSARGSGITSMVDDGSSGMTREERLQIAKAMLAEAQMKQNPEYYFNTLAQGDRPAMTRPVASSAPPPAMQQMPAAQQMAQMQAAGVRPVGMADGGEVRKGFFDGGLNTVSDRLTLPPLEPTLRSPEASSIVDTSTALTSMSDDDIRELAAANARKLKGNVGRTEFSRKIQDLTSGNIPISANDISGIPENELADIIQRDLQKTKGQQATRIKEEENAAEIKSLKAKTGLGSLFEELTPEDYAARQRKVEEAQAAASTGIAALPSAAQTAGGSGDYMAKLTARSRATSPDNAPPAEDRKLTALEGIKAEREAQKNQNFNMALMQAGLAMMGGKSSNALQNIAEGGISGLAAYTGLEKSDRETALAERKLGAYEDSLRRSEDYNIARAEALREKSVTARQNIAVRALGLAQKQLEQEIASDPTLGMDKSKRENRLLQITDQFMRDLSLDQQFGGGSAEDTLERGVDPEIAAAF